MVKRYYTLDRFIMRILVLTTLLNIMVLGGFLNVLAMSSNNGKMPVYTESIAGDDLHFTFTNPDEVNNFYLTDIIKARLGIFELYFSVGDIFIVGGLFIFFNYMVTTLILDGFHIYKRLSARVKVPHNVSRKHKE